MRGINIAVARDQDHIQAFPSKGRDFFGCGGDKHGRDAPFYMKILKISKIIENIIISIHLVKG